MGFLGKNINFALVLLILFVVLGAVGSAVFYQKVLSKRTSDYELSSSNLTECRTALVNYRDKLTQKETELNATSKDIQKYDTLYDQKVGELKNKDDELKSTISELNTVTLQKEQFKTKYSESLTTISQRDAQIASLNNQVLSLKDDINDLQDELDACENP